MDQEEKEGRGQGDGGFRVVDRRRFDAAGDEKPDARADETETKSERFQPKQGAPIGAAQQQTRAGTERAPKDSDYAPVDFSGFVISLATQAMVLLGEMPHPQTNTVSVDVEGARHTIDLIGILEQKTKGNLTPEESRLVAEVLSSLRLAFVNKSRRGSPSK